MLAYPTDDLIPPPPIHKDVFVNETRTKVLLVGNHQPLLDSLVGWFAAEQRPWVTQTCDGFDQALDWVRTDPVDVVIIDAGQSDKQAIATARAMQALHPRIKTVLLTNQMTQAQQEDAQQAGVSAYLIKYTLGDHLLHTLDTLLDHYSDRAEK
jgi:DNA-binding NarL/FixJ family response regulator